MSPPSSSGSSIRERARSGASVDPQDGLFDKQFDDPQLVAALEEREQHRLARADANALYKAADAAAKERLASYELAVGEVARAGRFRIKKTAVASREVSFETSPAERLTIGVVDDGS